ncbi:hypothetical protein ACWGTO_27765 [Mesorhizobium sp. PL10]
MTALLSTEMDKKRCGRRVDKTNDNVALSVVLPMYGINLYVALPGSLEKPRNARFQASFSL